MGTRSITTIRSRWEEADWETRAVIYRHWDGHPESHGKDLFDFLNGLVIVNGIGGNMPERFANGPGRLAAQLVCYLSEGGHDPDLMGEVGDCGQEFHYQIDVQYGMSGGEVSVTVFDGPITAFGAGGEDCTNEIFSGSVEAFGEFVTQSAVESE